MPLFSIEGIRGVVDCYRLLAPQSGSLTYSGTTTFFQEA